MQQITKLQSIKVTIATALLISFAWFGVLQISTATAQGIKSNICEGASLSLSDGSGDSCSNGNACKTKNKAGDCVETEAESKVNGLITTIINIISVVVGILAVIFIIIGGAKYITSGGDSGKVGSAKSTVIYAIVGLIIVALAQFIVRFVLAKAT